MSVVSVKEIWNGRNGGVDQSFLRRYVRVFQVITDDPNDGTATVGGAPGIPALYDLYVTPNESDFASRVSDIRPSQDTEDPRVWQVQVQYDGAQNPFTQLPVIKWSNTSRQRVIELDINNKPLLNSAGQFFDPPPEGDDDRPTVTITINQPFYVPSLGIDYQNAINIDPVTIAGLSVLPYQAKLSIEATRQQDNNYTWYPVTYTVEFQRDGWNKKILDQGRYHKGNGGKLTPCKDDAGSDVNDPVPLDGNGGQLDNPSPANCVYLTFDTYKQLPFSALGLPTTF